MIDGVTGRQHLANGKENGIINVCTDRHIDFFLKYIASIKLDKKDALSILLNIFLQTQ